MVEWWLLAGDQHTPLSAEDINKIRLRQYEERLREAEENLAPRMPSPPALIGGCLFG